MIQFVPAKINLGLYVTGKRPDGYHTLETVFYPIGLESGTPQFPAPFCDIVEIVPYDGESDRLTNMGNQVDCIPENNLCMKAVKIFREELAKETGKQLPPHHIILEKHIPFGAGLGGGSADATYTLLALNYLACQPFDSEKLEQIAVKLGADCPFFVKSEPAYAKGIGEILSPISLSLMGKWIGLAKPEEGISTKEAFAGISCGAAPQDYPSSLLLPPKEWKGKVKNVFEDSFFLLHPKARRIKEILYYHGAEYASLSGSGSTFFGIFSDYESARKAVEASGTPYITVLPCER